MASLSLQFRGVENAQLLLLLGWAIALILVGHGLWRWLGSRTERRGRWSVGAGVLAASATTAAALWVDMDTALGQGLWLLAIGAIVVAAVAVFYADVYAYLGRWRIAALLTLRCLAILSLLLVLFKPAVSVQPSAAARRPALTVLLDRSESMDTYDNSADLPNRYRRAVDALLAQQDRMDRHFRVTWAHFAEGMQEVGGPEELAGLSVRGDDCKATDIAGALARSVAAGSPDESAGIVLISDGLHNAAGARAPEEVAGESSVPIYVLAVGSEVERAAGRPNLQLLAVEAPLDAVRNNVTAIAAKVRITGLAGISSRVALREGGKELASRQVSSDRASQDVDVALDWAPGDRPAGATGPDIRRLEVAVEHNPAEATGDDNAAEVHVRVSEPSIRVLYVEGTLRPEFKFLRRTLASDPNVQLISLAQYADGRFQAQGSIEGKRLTGLPQTDEDFACLDVIILGDLDRSFLSRDQMDRIARFVNDGKALLMLGGRNSFGPGGYADTPIEAALPVLCGTRSQPQEATPFVPQLTAAAQASAIFEGLSGHFGGPDGPAADPVEQLSGCVAVPAAKAGAAVLAIHTTRRNDAGPLVVLAVHQYGAGRAAAFTADTTWRWYLRARPAGVESPYHRFWGQLVRHLAGLAPKQQAAGSSVLARADKAYARTGEELTVLAQVRDASGQPAAEANVSAAIAPADGGAASQLALAPAEGGAGLFTAVWQPDRPGKYVLSVSANDAKGAALGADELAITVAPHSAETDRLARDSRTLKAVAQAGRGRCAELAALPDVVDEIIARQAARLLPAPKASEHPLYNFALLLVLFVAMLTGEWLLRRHWQLQ